MKKTLKRILAAALVMIMAFGAAPFSAFAANSIVTDKGELTDYVTPTEVSDLNGVEIIEILDSDTKNALLVKNADGKFCYYTSDNGTDYVSTDLSSQLGQILGINMADVIDFKFTNLQEIEGKVIVHGWYSVMGQRDYYSWDGKTKYFDTEISKSFAVATDDGINFVNMNMPDNGVLYDESHIEKINGKYVYYPVRQLPSVASVETNYIINGWGAEDAENIFTCEGFFYTSENLKDWTISKTSQFKLKGISREEHITTLEYRVSNDGLAVYCYDSTPEGGIGLIYNYFAVTDDLIDYNEINTDFLNEGFIEGFVTADDGILVVFVGIVYWENNDYNGKLKNAYIYTVDMTDGKVEKVISEHSDNESIGWHLITTDNLERTLLYTDSTNGKVYYSNDGYKTVKSLELGSGDKDIFLFNTTYNMWRYQDYTVGVCNNVENKLSIIKDDLSEVYSLGFDKAEESFVIGDRLYIIADSKVYTVSMAALLSALNAPENPEEPEDPEITYTATWVVDGTVVATKEYKVGDTVEVPADPVKDGFVFIGWSPSVPVFMPETNLTFYADFQQIIPEVTVTSIRIINTPDVTEYAYMSNEELNLSGLSVEVTYSDGSMAVITNTSLLTVSELNTSKAGTQEITVEYEGCGDTFEVEVTQTAFQEVISIILEMIAAILDFLKSLGKLL